MNIRQTNEWLAYHIFYGMDARYILKECVFHLIDDLVKKKMISSWFFINYWLEGAHVRLRVKSRNPEFDDQIDDFLIREISNFMKQHPSLHSTPELADPAYYQKAFNNEYPPEEYAKWTDENGKPRFRPDNSIFKYTYEPEYGRYGGIEGMTMSEQHFHDSSCLVRSLIETGNLGTRSIRLGLSAQIMAVTVSCLFESFQEVLNFLLSYHNHWVHSFQLTPGYVSGSGRLSIKPTVEQVKNQIVPYVDACLENEINELPGFLSKWAVKCQGLKEQIYQLQDRGSLSFLVNGSLVLPSSRVNAVATLARSYLHMTNNRMLVDIREEAYLSFVLYEAIK
ncbi:MAG: lantibiotic dehydratase C-terminal domain-containing protein [Bifidobacterium asteroides]